MTPQPDTTKAKVVLVEDHPMFRERLAQVINRDLEMVAKEVEPGSSHVDDGRMQLRELLDILGVDAQIP